MNGWRGAGDVGNKREELRRRQEFGSKRWLWRAASASVGRKSVQPPDF